VSKTRRLLAAAAAVILGAGCRGEPMSRSGASVPGDRPTETVVLLHGLGRSATSLRSLARRLADEGFAVVNYDYASTRRDVASHAAELASRLPELLPAGTQRIHFVTHSLGGIVVRRLLADHAIDRLGRVVMLAPPNRGSELADALREVGILGTLLGPASVELGTRPTDAPKSLGPVRFECGVIAGDSSFNVLGPFLFDGPNDGKVSVESAKVDGMADFLVVHHGHTFLMDADDVQAQVVHFLRHGGFDHSGDHAGEAPASEGGEESR